MFLHSYGETLPSCLTLTGASVPHPQAGIILGMLHCLYGFFFFLMLLKLPGYLSLTPRALQTWLRASPSMQISSTLSRPPGAKKGPSPVAANSNERSYVLLVTFLVI